MIKDIWHTPPQTPDIFKSHPIIVVYEAGDQIEQMNSKEYSDLVGERYVNRWCYVDELIKENERTRKALDVAVDALNKINMRCQNTVRNHLERATIRGELCDISFYARKAIGDIDNLEQITALEQKE